MEDKKFLTIHSSENIHFILGKTFPAQTLYGIFPLCVCGVGKAVVDDPNKSKNQGFLNRPSGKDKGFEEKFQLNVCPVVERVSAHSLLLR